MNFYTKLPDMECLSGDTLPAFHIEVEGDISGASMQIILAKKESPDTAVVTKECTAEAGGFVVQLTDYETTNLLEGTYIIVFEMAQNNRKLKKLEGEIYVHRVAGGADSG